METKAKMLVLSTPASKGYVVAESADDMVETIKAAWEALTTADAEVRMDLAELPAYDAGWECIGDSVESARGVVCGADE